MYSFRPVLRGELNLSDEINTSGSVLMIRPALLPGNDLDKEISMPYVALEWDHKIGRPVIQWLVVKCQSVGQKFGGPQALPPRRDVAYFVNEETAERDAKAFADYKTRMDVGDDTAAGKM